MSVTGTGRVIGWGVPKDPQVDGRVKNASKQKKVKCGIKKAVKTSSGA